MCLQNRCVSFERTLQTTEFGYQKQNKNKVETESRSSQSICLFRFRCNILYNLQFTHFILNQYSFIFYKFNISNKLTKRKCPSLKERMVSTHVEFFGESRLFYDWLLVSCSNAQQQQRYHLNTHFSFVRHFCPRKYTARIL